jgi:hypothetical protein
MNRLYGNKQVLKSTFKIERIKRSFSTDNPLVTTEKVDKYVIVRMNRPPVNSLNTKVYKLFYL